MLIKEGKIKVKQPKLLNMVKEEFYNLSGKESEPAISIFLPTHSSGKEVNEGYDLIRFKNLLQAITHELNNKGLNNDQADKLLMPAQQLLKDEEFWLNLEQGMAVFIAEDFFEVKTLPILVPEEFHINSRFHLAPLVPLFKELPHFYLLAISKNASSFYKGDSLGIERMEIEGLPQGINDVIHFEEKNERQLLRGGPREGSAHGHGSGLSDEKEYISQYLKEVDQTLMTELLANENAPLVIAGVEYIVGIYRQVSRYKNLVEDAITGNHEHTELTQLFQRALELASPHLEEANKKALKNYYNQLNTALTSSMPEKVIPATYYKQVYDLFVEKDAHIWGSFDEAENKLVINQQKQLHDVCLVNRAIVNTITNGGDVYILEPERMPNGAQIAASLRF
jgi:hypothetical protein